MSLQKIIYSFGAGKSEAGMAMMDVLGGKGANLAEMCNLGLPVPPGFTIITEQCREFYRNKEVLSETLLFEVRKAINEIENIVLMGMKFGSEEFPLLLSVRSGASVSMPGMMDTILNLGLNDKTVEALAAKSSNKRFAYDSYRRFIQMYSDVVLSIENYHFETILDDKKLELNVIHDSDITPEGLLEIIAEYKQIVKEKIGEDFPQDPYHQLFGAIKAVFLSWMSDRAQYYRKMYGIDSSIGTAVTVQAMVFGNLGKTSATGVAFTRNPSDGSNAIYGEYLINAQGEDVVAGIRTPFPINIAGKTEETPDGSSLEETMPLVYKQFFEVARILEDHYRDMQDIEFTIQEGKLWFLQTRSGKRTIKSAIKIAVDMVNDGLISKEEAILRIDPYSIDRLLHKTIDAKASKALIGKGLPASPGAASGHLAFSPKAVVRMVKEGKRAILTRIETSPEDVEGMNLAEGILTSRGGMTSHAAVVARGMGKVCITSMKSISINYERGELLLPNGEVLAEGEVITIDGSTGEVYKGEVKTVDPELSEEFKTLMSWADKIRKLKVRANAETIADSKAALKFGAEGIGLCRTEHMFFDKDRVLLVRQMIVAESLEEREGATSKLLPFQTQDFIDILTIMDGLPVNIRLLDAPLHEFLPTKSSEIERLADLLHMETRKLEAKLESLHEVNPMLGHRGVRLGITYPEIYEMQVRAIFEAGYTVLQNTGRQPNLEIMIPLVIDKKEMEILLNLITNISNEFSLERGKKLEYSLGTMIETPRAALMASEIAEVASYFSFGTNDLTQMTFGISRDDSASFVPSYIENRIFDKDPFVKLDTKGVGKLIQSAILDGKSINPNLKTSVCGEHGGDPTSIKFCANLGMSYVSCSPFRLPAARLAAAIAEIENARTDHKF